MQKIYVKPKDYWMNDPNGFIYYKGMYHLFYQCFPYGPRWGRMHWGHVVSKDLVNWEEQGIALFPSKTDDRSGCFSGSAIEEDGKMQLYYTGVNYLTENPEDINLCVDEHFVSAQLMITSEDGIHFDNIKDKKTVIPVIHNADIGDARHTRDPKVWKDGDIWYMVLGSTINDKQGKLLFFTSTDGEEWKFENSVTRENFGWMWECPDYFTLEGQEVLSVSPQGLTREEFRFQNIYQSGYFILKDGKPEEKDFREWDHGFDFYAPQTFQDGKGRRILIGWMGMPDADEEYVNPTAQSEGWQHCLTVPREVTYKNGMLYQYPVKELNGLRENGTSISGSSVELPVNGPFDLDIQVKGDQGKVSLGENLFLEYQGGDVILTLSETAGAGRKVRKAHVPSGKVESLRILADTTAVEIYVNGGEVVFSTRYYPETQAQAVKVEAADVDGKIYGLKNYVME